ncbi:thiamine diphosphate-binding protein [Aureobasidium subglaciale]|nr:thiamine diphosphate-binding protein [Aureobasidium subglaciale]KAI5230851.1 thiamine diphosphate-binding protein [Aureobasidium subglaciale]KAI5233795.1 thiamine diphosphate-binding protein [Aureobasidium subglaciale]KAI5254050.1 thiamine diphosphate-binding protein [Aureobasidium subglaciale]KAI5267268.1 thiamine diphosphate-binding protein [Aureobasidium subglaciale]
MMRPRLLSSIKSQRPRLYATLPPKARLNTPTDFEATPLLNHNSRSALASNDLSSDAKSGTATRLNLFQAINSALSHALRTDPRVLLFGEDVAFGGVFRCSMNLASEFGDDRVFNTPLTEQGIVGFAIGAAFEGMRPVAEVQFADYVYPAFDQLVNEAAKARYHSQSPESLFTHIPGLRVVMPRGPAQAKGLLLAAIASNDPVVFMEPKILYRAAVEYVPTEAYEIPLSKAEIVKPGKDITIISYGTPLYTCSNAIAKAEADFGCEIELIDLRTIYPWDRPTIIESVKRTGKAIVVHESMTNAGVGAEVAATIQETCFLNLEAPVARVGGWSTHMGLIYERFNIPDVTRIYDAIKTTLDY